MTAVEASAPGKAVLCGEYAVLDGAPAIAMAVDRRATVRITETGDAWSSVSAPGLYDGSAHFRVTGDGSLEWRGGAADARRFALLEQVWRCVAPPAVQGLSLTLDTRPFFDEPGGPKLGLGSSAALGTALAAALSGEEAGASIYRTAAVAHRNFQHGKGSGVDVAAAVHGGVIGYRMEPLHVERLAWPDGLHFALLWSGRPASTADKLARLGAALPGKSGAGLRDAAAAVLAAWKEGSAAAVLERLGGYTEALRRFGAEHDLGIFDGGHSKLLGEARGLGLVYKPCGAGGGDIGIVLATARTALADFAARARAHGFAPLQAGCDAHGVQRAGGLRS